MSSFDDDAYNLGSCSLARLSKEQTISLGIALSRINPWKELGTEPEAISGRCGTKGNKEPGWGIFFDEKPVGLLQVKPKWLLGPYLELIALLPEGQSRGIGTAVMKWFEHQAVQAKSRNMFLCVSTFNDKAIKFYSGLGFEKVGVIEGLIVDGYDEILMRKRLQ